MMTHSGKVSMSEPYILATRQLRKSFGGVPVVNDINLQVPKGSIYGFLGPNGAGKTTTIRLLLGLITPDQGEISIFGFDLRSHLKVILRRVGSLVEAPSIYPRLTGRENLQVLTRLVNIPPNRIDEVLRLVELSDAAHRMAGQYSQGMKQRLGLAMALLNEPEFLVLDEPTNGLDPAGIREVRELLKRLSAKFGVTVFLSSHLLSEVELIATHLGIIHQGRLLFQGTLQELQSVRCGHTIIRVNDTQAALELLKFHAAACRFDGEGTLDVETSGPQEVARVNSILVEAGLHVYSIESRTHRLEDFFMDLTTMEGS
jgi:lantibiotic transport system ATP-binding protein